MKANQYLVVGMSGAAVIGLLTVAYFLHRKAQPLPVAPAPVPSMVVSITCEYYQPDGTLFALASSSASIVTSAGASQLSVMKQVFIDQGRQADRCIVALPQGGTATIERPGDFSIPTQDPNLVLLPLVADNPI